MSNMESLPQADVCLVNGPSRAMKSSSAKAIATPLLQMGLRVSVYDAGSFYRKNTVGTLEEVKRMGIENPTDADLHAAAVTVLEAGIPYDTDREWPDLHAPEIDNYVGRISKAPHVQEAGRGWWGYTYDYASLNGSDIIVFDGRNPRQRLQPVLDKYGIRPIMELLCECNPSEAAFRTLYGRGVTNPTKEQLRVEERSIITRRHEDATRPKEAYPYVPPEKWVEFEPGMNSYGVIHESYSLSDSNGDVPLPIRMDTTNIAFEPMKRMAGSLALAAWDVFMENDQSRLQYPASPL